MLARIRQFLAPPVFEDDEDKTRVANLLNVVLLTILPTTVLGSAAILVMEPGELAFNLVFGAVLTALIVGLWAFMRRGYIREVSVLISIGLWASITVLAYTGGEMSDAALSGYFLVIAISSLLLGGRAALIFGLLSILAASLGVLYASIIGMRTSRVSVVSVELISLAITLGATALLLRSAVQSINNALERARTNEHALAESNFELQAIRASLERRVADRTRDLERRAVQLRAAAMVARDAASAHEMDELLDRAVNLIRDRFGLYHAGIFLVDDQGEYAVLQAATGEAGRQMLAHGHRLKVGEVSVIGYVTGQGEPRIALDVGSEADRNPKNPKDVVHFQNPFLPETRSEMALPLRVGERVIGALDVQSREVAAFDDDDIAALEAMADQLAVAIENARLLNEMQETVRELEIASGQYTRESWRATTQGANSLRGYRYRRLGVEPVAGQSPEARQAWLQGSPVITPAHGFRSALEGGDDERGSESAGSESARSESARSESEESGDIVSTLAVPMKLRGQVVGVLNLRFEDEPISSETVSLVEEVANRLALALENVRLLEETRERAEQERIVANITARVRASMDPETILQTAVRELGAALGTSRAFVRMGGKVDKANDQ